jgi:hypothetical protein
MDTRMRGDQTRDATAAAAAGGPGTKPPDPRDLFAAAAAQPLPPPPAAGTIGASLFGAADPPWGPQPRHPRGAAALSAALAAAPRALRAWAGAGPTRALARALICSYFVNAAYASLATWAHFRAHPARLAALRRWPSDPPPAAPPFPWLHALVLLPAALWEAAVPAVWAAGLLATFVVWHDGVMAAMQIRGVLLHG